MKFNKHISDPAEEEHSSALISRALLFIGVCRLLVDPLCVFHLRPFFFFFVAAAMVGSPPSCVRTHLVHVQVHAASPLCAAERQDYDLSARHMS